MKLRTTVLALLTAVGTLVVPTTQASALPRPGEFFGAIKYPPVGGGCPNLKSQLDMRTKTKFDGSLTKSVLERNLQSLQPFELWFITSTFHTDLDYLGNLAPDEAKEKIVAEAQECKIVHDTCVATTNALQKLPNFTFENLTRERLANRLQLMKPIDLWEIAKLSSDALSHDDLTAPAMADQILTTAGSCDLLKASPKPTITPPTEDNPVTPPPSETPTPTPQPTPSHNQGGSGSSNNDGTMTIVLGVVAALAVVAAIGSAAFAAGAGNLPLPPRP